MQKSDQKVHCDGFRIRLNPLSKLCLSPGMPWSCGNGGHRPSRSWLGHRAAWTQAEKIAKALVKSDGGARLAAHCIHDRRTGRKLTGFAPLPFSAFCCFTWVFPAFSGRLRRRRRFLRYQRAILSPVLL